LRYTRIANLMGTCAVTLPTGHPSCGVMLLAGAFEEKRLLRLALGAEQALK
jgi:aspartyl-tRNA(Asn)/glutamyl-tRNA(Gln) amidotransferase subunit A